MKALFDIKALFKHCPTNTHAIIFLPSEVETGNTTLCLVINTNIYITIQIIDFLIHCVFSFIPGHRPLLFCINLIARLLLLSYN